MGYEVWVIHHRRTSHHLLTAAHARRLGHHSDGGAVAGHNCAGEKTELRNYVYY